MPESYKVTLVQSRRKDKPYAKVDGTYGGPTWLNDIGLQELKFDIDTTFSMFKKLIDKPLMCMVYGTAVKNHITNTDRTMKNFTEEPVHLITFDLDNYYTPNYKREGADVTYTKIVEDADYFIERNLPPEFHNTSYVLRFSSSFMLKEDGVLRAHIIFLSEKSQYPREIGLWMKQIEMPADPTFYLNLTQPVFTAAPVFHTELDPLLVREDYFPRVSLVRKERDLVEGDWLPLAGEHFKGDRITQELPSSSSLNGKIGSFCRHISPEAVLNYLGYSSEDNNRFLAPTSQTGLPGAIVFGNGYVYSHHDNDPINIVVDKVYGYRRRSLNAYDLMYSWAKLKYTQDPKIMSDFDFMMAQAVEDDQIYQDEIQEELVSRCDWLTPDGFIGVNKQIVTGLVQDAMALGMSKISQGTLAGIIASKTAMRKSDVENEFKNLRREKAFNRNEYDPDANLRHMAGIFKRQGILYSQHGTVGGDFWCYYKSTRMWRRRNKDQTEQFIYDVIHETIPDKIEIDFSKAEKLCKLIMRQACEDPLGFRPGAGWAFKEGKYGIIMDDLFRDRDWNPEKRVRTLQKEDHIYKMLPITYDQWLDSKNKKPKAFHRFLESTCQEDYDVMELIQEFGGYILGDSYYLHKFLIIEGLPGSGKSILGKVLQACVGPQFYEATSLNTIGARFGLGGMGGKKFAIMSEARSIDFAALRAAVPILLKITGGDMINTESKGKSLITEHLEIKIVVLTNRIPVLPDDTGALAQRMLMVKFNKVFRGTPEEVLGLDDILIGTELPAIARFFLEGLARLSKRKNFIEPKDGPSRAMKEAILQQIDPLKTFMSGFFEVKPHADRDDFISQKEFNRYFRAYCYRLNQNVDRKLIQRRGSIRNIQTLEPNVDKRRMTRTYDEKQQWILVGLVPNVELEMEFGQEIVELNTAEVD